MMSLGRLLAAGKSLVGIRDNGGRYRMVKHMSLPKFVAPKNPFRPQGEDSPPASTATRAPRRFSAAERAAAGLKQTQKLPVAATARSAIHPSSVSRLGMQVRAGAVEWARKLNPLPLRPRGASAPGRGPARLSRDPVQGELSLDKVKVVRNDLSDADLEVVAVDPAAGSGGTVPVLGVAAGGAAAGGAWTRFTSRFFGVDAT